MSKVCTICGKVLDIYDEQQKFGFDYHVGYGSKYDLLHIRANFCCNCFDGIIDSLQNISKEPIVVGEYS